MRREYFILVLILSCIFGAKAQFMQRGVTLEYNRNKAKTTYVKPISIRTDNAEPSVSSNGCFVLNFTKSVKAGDTIKSPEIKVSDEKYVLFNKDHIQGWVLSPQKQMEILVCKKEIIDFLESTYTNNYVHQLKSKYIRTEELLKKATEDEKELKQKLDQLKADYERDVKMIRARAILFAYVDETQKDSLELLRRECIINNDLERAKEIGEEMNLVVVSNGYIQNLHKSKAAYTQSLKNLYDCASIMEDHIQICESTESSEQDEETEPYYESLKDIYKTLLEELKDSKLYDKQYNDIEDKLGTLLYNQYLYHKYRIDDDSLCMKILEEAASYDNTAALYELADHYDYWGEEEDPNKCKSYLKRLVSAIKYKGRDLPASDFCLYDYEEWLESFPDFLKNTKGGTFGYSVLNDDEVSWVSYNPNGSKTKKLVMPSEIEHEGKRYSLVKVGRGVMSIYNSPDEIEQQHLREIVLPNTIRYIGCRAFYSKWMNTITVNMPSSLKIIRDGAYHSCEFKNNIIDIPEGVEEIGKAWQSDEEKGLTLKIPSTAKTVNLMAYLYDGNDPLYQCEKIHRIILSPNNKNFRVMYDLLYSADSSFVFAGGLNRDDEQTKILYIPKNLLLKTEGEYEDNPYSFFDNQYVGAVDSLIVDPDHPEFTLYHGILYDKKLEKLILKPQKVNKIVVPTTLKEIETIGCTFCGYSGTHYIFPQEIDPDLFVDIMMNEAAEGATTVEFYGIKREVTCSISCDDDIDKFCSLVSLIDSAIIQKTNDDKLQYIKGRLYLEVFDISSAKTLLNQTEWNNNLLKEKLSRRIDKAVLYTDSMYSEINKALAKLPRENNFYSLICDQEKFARIGDAVEAYKLACLYYLRGMNYSKLDSNWYKEEAEKDCQKAVSIICEQTKDNQTLQNDYLSDLYLSTAILYYNDNIENNIDIVKLNLELSLQVNPDNVKALECMGLVNLFEEEPENAKQMFERMKELDMDYANKSILRTEIEKK